DIALPAFLTIILMPFSYSITVGIGVGFLSYVAIRVARGKVGQVHPLLWVVSALFVAYFTRGPLRGLFRVCPARGGRGLVQRAPALPAQAGGNISCGRGVVVRAAK
ncbi:MAG: hypothetical protein Q4D69_09990, partial [Buchananella hordeovulneris]|nr:hypothetical protein [Buchananella hordeovulneris]